MRQLRWALIGVLCCLAAAPAVDARKVKRASAPASPVIAAPATPTLGSNEQRWLDTHNRERSRLGATPLNWSPPLAASAARWAAHLAKTNSFDHAVQTTTDEGENLWMGTRGAYTPEDMVGMWIDERAKFKRGLFPDVSTTGQWSDVGHYTQLIWYKTRRIGCALASNAESDFLVCRYDPPGNWIGESPFGPAAASPKR